MAPPKEESSRVKSAYERALERLEEEGISRPREEAFSPQTLAAMTEVRRKAEAKLAELEILHQDALKNLLDPGEREEAEKHYSMERQRIEAERDRKLDELRRQ